MRHMRFSDRTAWDLGENSFAGAVREARSSGRELIDLTVSNPTACGFTYDESALLSPLSEAGALLYEPEALGMRSARLAVAAYYADAGTQVRLRATSVAEREWLGAFLRNDRRPRHDGRGLHRPGGFAGDMCL